MGNMELGLLLGLAGFVLAVFGTLAWKTLSRGGDE